MENSVWGYIFWLMVLGFALVFITGYARQIAEEKRIDEKTDTNRGVYKEKLFEFEQDCSAMSEELSSLGKVREEEVFRRIIHEEVVPVERVWAQEIPPLPDISEVLERAVQEVERTSRERAEELLATRDREVKEATWKQLRYEFEKLKTTRKFKQWVREQWECQRGQCAWCEKPIMMWPNRDVVVDHVKPLSYRAEEQGDNSYDNLVLSCYKCNDRKGDEEGYYAPGWIMLNKFSPAGEKEFREIAEQEKAAREATIRVLSEYCSRSTKQLIAKRHNVSSISKAIEKELASISDDFDVHIEVTERRKGEIDVHGYGGGFYFQSASEQAFTDTFFPDYEEVRRSSGETPGARGLGTHAVYDRVFLRGRDSPRRSVQLLFRTGVETHCGGIEDIDDTLIDLSKIPF